MLCETCDKREYCLELCVLAEIWVDQDYIAPHACLFCENYKHCSIDYMESYLCGIQWSGDCEIDLINPEEIEKMSTKSSEELIIQLYFMERKKQVEIAGILNVSKQYVSTVVTRYKEILKKNLQK